MTLVLNSARSSDSVDLAVGSRLRYLRRKHELSQKDLAGSLGISFQQVQKYEKGVNRISAGRLWQISTIFNVTPNYFYCDVLDNTPSGYISPEPLSVASTSM